MINQVFLCIYIIDIFIKQDLEKQKYKYIFRIKLWFKMTLIYFQLDISGTKSTYLLCTSLIIKTKFVLCMCQPVDFDLSSFNWESFQSKPLNFQTTYSICTFSDSRVFFPDILIFLKFHQFTVIQYFLNQTTQIPSSRTICLKVKLAYKFVQHHLY